MENNILRIYLEILVKSLTNQSKIINGQLELKLGQFMKEEFDEVLKKIKKPKNYWAWWNSLWSLEDKKI